MANRQDEYKLKGNEFFKNKKFQDAIEWYTKAIDEDPNVEAAAAIYSNRCASWQGLNNHLKAIEDAESCVRVRPNWLKGHFRKAVSQEAMGQVDAALKSFEAALATEPKNEEVQERVGTLRAQIKERNNRMTPAACKTMMEAKTIGNSLFSDGKYELAVTFYTRGLALAVSPEDKVTLLTNRAACRQQAHDYTGVMEDANAALAIDPNHVKALLRRAIALEGVEKWQAALDDYNAVNRLSPGLQNVSQGVVRCQRALRG